MTFSKPKFLTEAEINTIRGKASVGAASVEEIMKVFGHLDAIETGLDRLDSTESLGTDGWRYLIGMPEE